MDVSDLHRACSELRVANVVELLSKDVDVNCRDQFKRTPLHCLIGSNSIWSYYDSNNRSLDNENKLTIAKLLLSKGANPNAVTHTGLTPLHVAVSNVNYEMVELLLKYGAKPWFRNAEGKTPLHLAAQTNSSDIIVKFLGINLSPDIIDYKGRTPLHEAVCYQFKTSTKIVEVFIKYGASVNWQDCKLRTPLHNCLKEKKFMLGQVLLENGADPSLPDEDGLTPMHFAASVCDANFLKLMISHKADVNSQSSSGNTPLHLAVIRGDEKIVKVLLKHHANANLTNNKQDTPLHLALYDMSPQVKVIETLVKSDADLNKTNISNDSPLDLIKSPRFQTKTKEIIIHQALKLKAAHLTTFNEDNDKYLLKFDKNYYEKCLNEIDKLKANNLYKLLTNSVDILSNLIKNKELERKWFSVKYSKDYPVYSGIIETKLKMSLHRKQLVVLGEKRLCALFSEFQKYLPYLPPECYPFILKYFDIRELFILAESNF